VRQNDGTLNARLSTADDPTPSDIQRIASLQAQLGAGAELPTNATIMSRNPNVNTNEYDVLWNDFRRNLPREDSGAVVCALAGNSRHGHRASGGSSPQQGVSEVGAA
jgi:hypothetical protein